MIWEVTAVKGESLEIFEHDKLRLTSSHSKDRFQVTHLMKMHVNQLEVFFTVSELILYKANYYVLLTRINLEIGNFWINMPIFLFNPLIIIFYYSAWEITQYLVTMQF